MKKFTAAELRKKRFDEWVHWCQSDAALRKEIKELKAALEDAKRYIPSDSLYWPDVRKVFERVA